MCNNWFSNHNEWFDCDSFRAVWNLSLVLSATFDWGRKTNVIHLKKSDWLWNEIWGAMGMVGEVDEPDFWVKMVAIALWIRDRGDCWPVLHWRTFQRLSATRLLRHFKLSLAQESVVFPSSGNKHRRRIVFSLMLWCAASSEKDLVMGMIQRALSGVDLSSRHLQAARQVQASPGLNGPPVNLSWRKPKNLRCEKKNFIPFFFHAHCYKSAMIFTPFFLVHAGFPERTNQVTLQSNIFHLTHSCKYRIGKKWLIIFFLACACSSFQCCM